jgi:polyhydroxybutyrate depolymerase
VALAVAVFLGVAAVTTVSSMTESTAMAVRPAMLVRGMPQPSLAPGTTTTLRSVTVDGMARSYLVLAPARMTARLPAIMMLHGIVVTAQLEAARSGFLPLAQAGKAVLLFPIGYQESWNAGSGCCGKAATAGVDDVAFLDQVAADSRANLPILPGQEYLVGYSNGGKMAFTEVCAHPGVFAALATFGGEPLAACSEPQPMPLLVAGGDQDPDLASARPARTATQTLTAIAATWRSRDGCTGSMTRTVGIARIRTASGCSAGTAVESVLYHGLDHYWPMAGKPTEPYSTDVGSQAAAATLMWNFFRAVTTGMR